MFCNTEKGAKASATIYSLIETCKANSINPYKYLRYVLDNIHKAGTEEDLNDMLPYNLDKSLLEP